MVILLFGALTVYLSSKMPIGSLRAAGPGLFPLSLGILLMLLAGTHAIGNLLRNRRRQEAAAGDPDLRGSVKTVIGFMAAIGVGAVVLEHLGYAPTAFLVVLALLQILGRHRWRWNLLISLASSTVSHVVFVRWLQIPFPQGLLGL
jgi:Tripartite tricarboxylate transporter TctB family